MERDLGLIRDLGANCLRLYYVPPAWFRDLARTFGLRLLVGIPWAQHVRFLDSARERAAVRDSVAQAARELRDDVSLLAHLVGNEIPPDIVRWYGHRRIERFVDELSRVVHDTDPEALVTYANFPTTEYLELPGVDFASFNLYLHDDAVLRRYVGRLQNLVSPKPLVITEFGIDSLREGVESQSEILARTVGTLEQLGCAGSVVFSYTDEWHTGGHDIEDWAFGLVTRDREPKPAYEAVRRVFAAPGPVLPEPAPRVSVVICAYNAERTLEECLESLRHLRYPDYEVIVVDDGSTDRTREIAERYEEFRLISHENRGLSAARNDGLAAATGEIVAYTDADCAVDPDWITFLVSRLCSDDFAGVGGPNLPPAEEDWMPEVVARLPGGPTHVLLTDQEAEHVPGCNMAFWCDELRSMGGFDPVYHAAGDDVDICWRLQERGRVIGFSPAALVWHRRRHTAAAYLKQQRGYGEAEALLAFRHPHRFNDLGQSRWLGRIYNDLGPGVLARRAVIYGGRFGRALFQTLYEAPAALLPHLPATLEWAVVALLAVGIGWLSLWTALPLPLLLIAGMAMLGISLLQVVGNALRADVKGLPRLRARFLVAVLTYLGPLLRAKARYRHRAKGLSGGGGRRARARLLQALGAGWNGLVRSGWSETGIEKEEALAALVEVLERGDSPVLLDDGWRSWDFALLREPWLRGEVKLLVQNHGGDRRQVDAGLWLRRTWLTRAATPVLLAGALFAALVPTWWLAAPLAAAGLAVEVTIALHARQLVGDFAASAGEAFGRLDLAPIPTRSSSRGLRRIVSASASATRP